MGLAALKTKALALPDRGGIGKRLPKNNRGGVVRRVAAIEASVLSANQTRKVPMASRQSRGSGDPPPHETDKEE